MSQLGCIVDVNLFLSYFIESGHEETEENLTNFLESRLQVNNQGGIE